MKVIARFSILKWCGGLMHKLQIKQIFPTPAEGMSSQCQHLESIFEYPLGDDYFYIDHGEDYFQFFKQIGRPVVYAALDGEKVVAVGAGIIREAPLFTGSSKKSKIWYLCDLKVHPDYRGNNLTIQIFRKAFFWNYLKCQRGYGISMDPKGRENHVVKITQRFPWTPVKFVEKLNIYQLDNAGITKFDQEIRRLIGDYGIKTNFGVKDIILKSNQQKMQLHHMVFEKGASVGEFSEGTYMFCLPQNSSYVKKITELGIEVSSTASILSHGIKSDWMFINTSEI